VLLSPARSNLAYKVGQCGFRFGLSWWERASWVVSGSQVTLTLTTEKGMNTWDFCAQGSALHLHMAHHGFGIAVLDRGMDIEADVLLTR